MDLWVSNLNVLNCHTRLRKIDISKFENKGWRCWRAHLALSNFSHHSSQRILRLFYEMSLTQSLEFEIVPK